MSLVTWQVETMFDDEMEGVCVLVGHDYFVKGR